MNTKKMISLELTEQELTELYMCYMRGCRGNNPREINKALDGKMLELVVEHSMAAGS